MERLVRPTASQGAELERVGPSRLRVNGEVRSLIRLWKGENLHASSGGTQEDEIGNTKFEIRKSETQFGMIQKSAPPFQKAKPKG